MDKKQMMMYGAGALIGVVALYFVLKPKPAQQDQSSVADGYSNGLANSMSSGFLPIDNGGTSGGLTSDQILGTLSASQKAQSDQSNATTAGALIDSITSQFFGEGNGVYHTTAGGIQAELNVGGQKYDFSYVLTPPVTPNSDPKSPTTYSSPIKTASGA